MALGQRQIHEGQTIHYSDQGSQYLSILYTTTLSIAGTVGEIYDNAKDEVYKTILDIEEPAPRGTPTFAEWFETWQESKNDVEDSAIKEYLRLIRSRVIPDLGPVRLADLEANRTSFGASTDSWPRS